MYLSLFGLSGLLSLSVGSIVHWAHVLQLESLIGGENQFREGSEVFKRIFIASQFSHSFLHIRHPHSISIGNEDYTCAKTERKHCAEHVCSFCVISFILNQLLQVIIYLSNEITEVKSCSVTLQGKNCLFRREVSLLKSGKPQY